MVNCAECGNRTLRPERVKKEGVGWVLVCQACFEKLGKTKATPKERIRRGRREGHIRPEPIATKTYKPTPKIERCKAGFYYNLSMKKCLPIPKKYKTTEQVRRFLRRHQREQVHLPAPQVPAQPVVPVGPITVEQRLDDVELRLIEVEKNMANVLGLLGQREAVKRQRKSAGRIRTARRR